MNVNFIRPPRTRGFWRPEILFQVLYHMQSTRTTLQNLLCFHCAGAVSSTRPSTVTTLTAPTRQAELPALVLQVQGPTQDENYAR